jgi:sulfatase maturation enzyme AslB (radical SAM superfamily)
MIKEVINNYKNNFLRIEYMLGNVCNYKCNYCFPGSNEGDKPWPNLEITKKHFSHLLDHYITQGKKYFRIVFGWRGTNDVERPSSIYRFLKIKI